MSTLIANLILSCKSILTFKSEGIRWPFIYATQLESRTLYETWTSNERLPKQLLNYVKRIS